MVQVKMVRIYKISFLYTVLFSSLTVGGKIPNRSIIAHYEYDAFGDIVSQSGPMADDFTFRFSTKYYENETGIVHYEKRPYSPPLGRFISCDPVEEDGGVNLYVFCGNDPVNSFDYLGMVDCKKENVAISVHGAGDEGAFDGRAKTSGRGKGYNVVSTGKELLNTLAKKSGTDANGCCHCIETLTIHSHGNCSEPYNGIIMSQNAGFYREKSRAHLESYEPEARDVEDLKIRIDDNNISFCASCTIKLFGCWAGKDGGVAEALSKATSCTVVGATGKVAPEIKDGKETGGRTGGSWMDWQNGKGERRNDRIIMY